MCFSFSLQLTASFYRWISTTESKKTTLMEAGTDVKHWRVSTWQEEHRTVSVEQTSKHPDKNGASRLVHTGHNSLLLTRFNSRLWRGHLAGSNNQPKQARCPVLNRLNPAVTFKAKLLFQFPFSLKTKWWLRHCYWEDRRRSRSVDPGHRNPLAGGAHQIDGLLQVPDSVIDLIVDDGLVKVVGVGLLQDLRLLLQPLQRLILE